MMNCPTCNQQQIITIPPDWRDRLPKPVEGLMPCEVCGKPTAWITQRTLNAGTPKYRCFECGKRKKR